LALRDGITAAITPEYGGRSAHLTFEIKIDLNRPGEITLEGEPFGQEQEFLAA
jgi:hypothetical protein